MEHLRKISSESANGAREKAIGRSSGKAKGDYGRSLSFATHAGAFLVSRQEQSQNRPRKKKETATVLTPPVASSGASHDPDDPSPVPSAAAAAAMKKRKRSGPRDTGNGDGQGSNSAKREKLPRAAKNTAQNVTPCTGPSTGTNKKGTKAGKSSNTPKVTIRLSAARQVPVNVVQPRIQRKVSVAGNDSFIESYEIPSKRRVLKHPTEEGKEENSRDQLFSPPNQNEPSYTLSPVASNFVRQVHHYISEMSVRKPKIVSWVNDGAFFKINQEAPIHDLELVNYFDGIRDVTTLKKRLSNRRFTIISGGEFVGAFFHPKFHRDWNSEAEFSKVTKRNGGKATPVTSPPLAEQALNTKVSPKKEPRKTLLLGKAPRLPSKSTDSGTGTSLDKITAKPFALLLPSSELAPASPIDTYVVRDYSKYKSKAKASLDAAMLYSPLVPKNKTIVDEFFLLATPPSRPHPGGSSSKDDILEMGRIFSGTSSWTRSATSLSSSVHPDMFADEEEEEPSSQLLSDTKRSLDFDGSVGADDDFVASSSEYHECEQYCQVASV